MALTLKYDDLKDVSLLRNAEAKILFNAGMWHGSCYLAGYCVELALKACITKNINQEVFFDKNSAMDFYTHDPVKLIKLAKLDAELDLRVKNDKAFGINWSLFKSTWSETLRYEKHLLESEARDLQSALNDENHGIFIWIQSKW